MVEVEKEHEMIFGRLGSEKYNATIEIHSEDLKIVIEDDIYYEVVKNFEFKHNHPGFSIYDSNMKMRHFVASVYDSTHLLYNILKIEIKKLDEIDKVDSIKVYLCAD